MDHTHSIVWAVLYSVESKLGRLQGTDKRTLKSRDILNALTEARDDHLSDSNFDPTPQERTIPPHTGTVAVNDPWNSSDNDQDTTATREDRLERLQFDCLEDDDHESGYRGAIMCWPCGWCSRRRTGRDRSRTRSVRNKLTPEEESAFLLHCDHLSRL